MLVFDVDASPPTRQEIQSERDRLKKVRKQLLRSGLISDGLHALILFTLYFSKVLSGRGLVVAILFGTVISIVLATGSRKQLAGSDRLSLLIIMIGAGLAVGGILVGYFSEDLITGILAGLATCSLVASGSLLGRRIMQVLSALESLEQIDAEHPAHRELVELCRQYPDLEEYRRKARDILRPFLTFGELKVLQQRAAELGRKQYQT